MSVMPLSLSLDTICMRYFSAPFVVPHVSFPKMSIQSTRPDSYYPCFGFSGRAHTQSEDGCNNNSAAQRGSLVALQKQLQPKEKRNEVFTADDSNVVKALYIITDNTSRHGGKNAQQRNNMHEIKRLRVSEKKIA